MRRYERVPEHVTEYLVNAEAGALTPAPPAPAPKKRRRIDIERLHADVTAAERQAEAWRRHGLPGPTDASIY